MGLNDIALPASLIADFYKYHLLEDAVVVPPVAASPGSDKNNKPAKKSIQYLGNNQKGICLVVAYPKDVYLPDEQLQFLTNILQACRLNMGDVAIVNQDKQQISFAVLKKELNCQYLLIFGTPPVVAGLPELPLFTAQNVDDCFVVCAPVAEQLNGSSPESKMLKTKLWICLKQLFNV